MEAITEQEDRYAEFISILQQNNKLTDNDLNKALEYAIKSNEMSPKQPRILDTLGVIQLKSNDIEGAFNTLGEAYSILPNDVEIIIHLAQTQQARKNHKNVEKLLTNLTEQDKQKWADELKSLLQK